MADFDLSLVIRGSDQGASAAGQKLAGTLDNVASSERRAGAEAASMAASAQKMAAAATAGSGAMTRLGGTTRLAAHHASNLTFQLNDIAVGFASGQRPMTIFMQQGAQIAQIMQQAGLGVKGFISQLAQMTGIIKITTDATAAADAAAAASSAKVMAAAVARTLANVEAADTELALAAAAVRGATSSKALTAAQERLAAAHVGVAAAAAEATIAEDALAVAQGRAAQASKAALATQVTSLGRVGAIAVPLGVTLGLVAAAFKGIKDSAASDTEMKKFAASLGLTHKEMKKLKDETVTWGDVFGSTMDVILARAGTSAEAISSAFGSAFGKVGEFGKFSAQIILAAFAASIKGVISLFSNLPGIIGNAGVAAANLAIEAFEKFANKGVSVLNTISAGINSVFKTDLPQIADVSLGRVTTKFSGNFGNVANEIGGQFNKTFRDVERGFDKISAGASARARKRLKEQADEIIGDRTPKKGRKGAKPTDPFGLEEFGRDAADRIRALAEGFLDIPPQVERVNKAIRQLDDLLDDIRHKKPPNMKELLADGERARVVIREGINKPFNDYILDQQRSLEIAKLITGGREDEAAALQVIQGLERQMGPLTVARKDAILASVQALRAEARQLEINRERQKKYLDQLSAVKETVQGIFNDPIQGLKDLPKRLIAAVSQFRADQLFEQLFGDTFRQLEDQITGANTAKDAAERMATAVDGVTASARRVEAAFNGVAGAATNAQAQGGGVDPLAPLPDPNGEIVVTGRRPVGLPQILEKLAKGVGVSDEAAGKIGRITGKAVGGAATGAMVNSFMKPLGKALGFKTSATGAQIGGAIGSFIPIPGGDIIGSIIGSVVGGLFKKTKSGRATITSIDGPATLGGNSGQMREAAGVAAQSIQDGLSQIAEQLGGGVGSFNVTIGQRHGDWRVNTSGTSLKIKKGAKEFNDDAEGAIAFAIMDAIKDGAITGLSAAVKSALSSSTDINKALREALNVQGLEDLIGGLGNSLSRQFKDFDRVAAERVRLAKKYGLDLLAVERINAEQRAELVKNLIENRIGSLTQFQKDMKFGDLFEGDASTRRNALLAEIATAQAEAEKGNEGAADRLADLYRQLIDTSKEAFGTAGPELAADRALAASGVDKVIEMENARIAAAQAYQANALTAANENNALTNETNNLLAIQNSTLQGILAAFGGGGGGGGGGLGGLTGRVANL